MKWSSLRLVKEFLNKLLVIIRTSLMVKQFILNSLDCLPAQSMVL